MRIVTSLREGGLTSQFIYINFWVVPILCFLWTYLMLNYAHNAPMRIIRISFLMICL